MLEKTRWALVTGASSGLGRSLVRLLVTERGMSVIATARRRDRLDELAAELPRGKVLAIDGDIADPGFRDRLWNEVERLEGGLDLLVNNAGIGHYSDFGEEDPAMIERILAVNVHALFDLTRRAVGTMRARGGGRIVQISSVLGEFGIPYSATYTASKHAVNGLVKSLRHELRGSGVRVQAALPGRFASEFRFHSLGDREEPGRPIGGEPTERVARGILKGLDSRRTFVAPTWSAWATVTVSRILRGPFDAFISVWGRRQFGREMGKHDV
ncbi:MAG: SDR family NAD(P)-dependent oxidoreductase [Isosphaeraceae bacterium]|nr:SDR family NAD(P)-dependent oxidoreductase [Isosphaeraceae bacterium]